MSSVILTSQDLTIDLSSDSIQIYRWEPSDKEEKSIILKDECIQVGDPQIKKEIVDNFCLTGSRYVQLNEVMDKGLLGKAADDLNAKTAKLILEHDTSNPDSIRNAMFVRNYIQRFEKASFYFPPLDYKWHLQETLSAPDIMKTNPKNQGSEVKRQLLYKYNTNYKLGRDRMNIRRSCAEIILTLISVICFQQVTIEEVVQMNNEMAILVETRLPDLARDKTIFQRILQAKNKENMKIMNNHISLWCYNRLDELIRNHSFRERIFSEEAYVNDVRRAIIRSRNYLNACYSKNVNKSRRLFKEISEVLDLMQKQEKVHIL